MSYLIVRRSERVDEIYSASDQIFEPGLRAIIDGQELTCVPLYQPPIVDGYGNLWGFYPSQYQINYDEGLTGAIEEAMLPPIPVGPNDEHQLRLF